MNDSLRRTALITGASAGIGAAFARLLAARGFDLVLVARRKERLEELAGALREEFGGDARSLPEDLADPLSTRRLASALEDTTIDVLINNAGYGLTESFSEATWQQHAQFIQVMGTGVAEMCHTFVPGMVERGWGRVVNVSSLAAFAPETPGSLYGAVKSFVVHLSESLALELTDTGVFVSALCPGFTVTEFHDVMDVRASIDALPGFMVMDAERVVRDGWEACERGQAVHVSGPVNQGIEVLLRWIPRGIKARIGARRMLRPKTGTA